ncbi:family 78 glycoside hydrolase catalytic domain [Rathayibacter sp. VKM Ac-2760]|uniref:family 78 glycoside hydrolase catalytic domain n=1 Tax=Rathayibacter sp. VKM Ac-2760 TaxID=2609253 RepID=UPI0013167859|nr:family 78 glycoside hydrolase catalytic domain [Rathayibacter sp. VKM Ac-2760]QHC57828.1 family 78 glycoside hydrolase catalytic domain [Rathayibacter sp. VKM Ac-2760]
MTESHISSPGGAQFIAAGHAAAEGDPVPYFRRVFHVGEGLRSARLRVTALGIVTSLVNGRRVGADVLAPGWTSYHHRIAVSEYEVTGDLGEGDNVLGALVAEGWAVGNMGYELKRHHYSDRPALYMELTLDYGDRTELIVTDDSFRVGEGAVRSASIYDGETYDARLEPSGWQTPQFDDATWSRATVHDSNLSALIEDGPPPIRRIEELRATSVINTPAGRTVVDFGQVLTGWVRLRVTGRPGQTVTFRHAELLNAQGEPEYETLRTAKATDSYTLRGEGEETWEPAFTFHGFRYVDIEGWPGDLDPADLVAVVVHSDMERTGWLETSDPLLNRLHENVVWSMRGNFVGVPTDCPQRDERLGWTGDIHTFAPTAAFLYDVRDVLGSWLQDVVAEQREKGFIPFFVPDVSGLPSAPTAQWGDVIVGLPVILYREYGDEGFLRRYWSAMTAYVDQVESLLDATGRWSSGHQFGDWLDPDAPSEDAAGGKTDRYLVATACFAKTVSQMAEAARVLDLHDQVARYTTLARRVRDAFRDEYVSRSGRLVSDSATAYSLAICYDLLDPQQREHAGARLAQLVTKAGYRISTGFVGTPLVAHALSDTGHVDVAYLLLTEQECPSFLYPLTQGATTIWERWDAIRPDGSLDSSGLTSLNHYALGSIAQWMYRVIGGLEALEPGYRRMRIAPQPGGGLTSAELVHDTIRGQIRVSWSKTAGELTVTVTVPEGASAEVVLPDHPVASTLEVQSGTHTWTYAVSEEQRETYTFDTSLQTLAADRTAWRALTQVFKKHLPFPIDASGAEAASITVAMLLTAIPHSTPELESDLRAALASL